MRTLLLLLLCVLSSPILAQNPAIRNQELSFTIGIAELDIDKYPPNQHLDFLNYVDYYPGYADFILLKMGYRFDLFSKISADIKLVMLDDIIPDNYDVSAYYALRPWLGLGLGSMLTKNWITYFEEYQVQSLPDYYLVNDNVKQFNTYEWGFYISPRVVPISTDVFKLQFTCDVGLSSFKKEEVSFVHKKRFSNEIRYYHYETTVDYQPYIQPKVDIRIKAFSINEASFGLLLNSNYYYSNRNMPYSRTLQTWTSENSVTELITPAKHKYARLEMNLGVFITY